MKKYTVTFEVDVYAEAPLEALKAAALHVPDIGIADFPDDAAEAFKVLPSAGATGAPHTAAGFGWRCIFTVDEAD